MKKHKKKKKKKIVFGIQIFVVFYFFKKKGPAGLINKKSSNINIGLSSGVHALWFDHVTSRQEE